MGFKPRHHSGSPLPARALTLVLVGNLACAKQVSVNGQRVSTTKEQLGQQHPAPAAATQSPAPVATPIQLPAALGTDRTYFQSRSTISLKIAGPGIEAGGSYSLVNNTTKQVIVDKGALSLADEGGGTSGGLQLGGFANTVLRLHLLDSGLRAKFAYPQDELQLQVDGEPPIVAKKSIVLRDFRAGRVQLLHFGTNQQRSGKLQGELGPVHGATVTSGRTILTSGFVPMINQ